MTKDHINLTNGLGNAMEQTKSLYLIMDTSAYVR